MNAIMLGVTGLFMVPLVREFFPPDNAGQTTVRFGVGTAKPGEESKASTGGSRPRIVLFGTNGNRIGIDDPKTESYIGESQHPDIPVFPLQRGNTETAEYISITASGKDAVCISYIAITVPNGDYYSFIGNTPVKCGAVWYESRAIMAGTDVRPQCFWLSSDDRFLQGLSFRLSDFTNPNATKMEALSKQYDDQPDSLCKSQPRIGLWKTMTEKNCIPYFKNLPAKNPDGTDQDPASVIGPGDLACTPGPNTTPPKGNRAAEIFGSIFRKSTKRGSAARPDAMERRQSELSNSASQTTDQAVSSDETGEVCHEQLVVSDLDGHSSKRLCESSTSWGPDFVSTVEKTYCDMCNHELWDLCSAEKTTGCFDLDARKLRPRLAIRGSQDVLTTHEKEYTNVDHWK